MMNGFFTYFTELINFNDVQVSCLLRVCIAGICGAIIGLERRKRQKDAGIRTHMIVAMGACLMMILSKYGFADIYAGTGEKFDASRMAAQVVSGVGFLGAGMIFINKKNSVSGLTTAAGIWTTSGIAMAIGDGMYFLGISVTILILIFQSIFHSIIRNERGSVQDIQIIISENYDYIDELHDKLVNNGVSIIDSKITKSGGKIILDYSVVLDEETFEKVKNILFKNENIIGFSI